MPLLSSSSCYINALCNHLHIPLNRASSQPQTNSHDDDASGDLVYAVLNCARGVRLLFAASARLSSSSSSLCRSTCDASRFHHATKSRVKPRPRVAHMCVCVHMYIQCVQKYIYKHRIMDMDVW